VRIATGEPAALEFAEEAFAWFDRHAHDDANGGYHGWLRRDGAVICSAEDVPPGAGPSDPLGHEVGLKDINVQGDWFEALLELEGMAKDPRVRKRRQELGEVYLGHLTSPDGDVYYAFDEGWTVQSGREWYGYGFQAAHRMWSAGERDGNPDFATRAEAILLHTVRRAGLRGGFAFSGPPGSGRPGLREAIARRREERLPTAG
jgi:hypothetical protein